MDVITEVKVPVVTTWARLAPFGLGVTMQPNKKVKGASHPVKTCGARPFAVECRMSGLDGHSEVVADV